MATASELIKARRQAAKEKAHVIEQTPAEKEAEIAALFAKISTTPAPPPVATTEPTAVTGVEIYSTFGGGSMIINGKSVTLPFVVTDSLTLLELRSNYDIDTPHSVIRSRRLA